MIMKRDVCYMKGCRGLRTTDEDFASANWGREREDCKFLDAEEK